MRNHIIFIIIVVALAWLALYFGYIEQFWLRVLGAMLMLIGFLFVFMLTDEVIGSIRSFGVDLIVIGIAMLVVWV